MHRGIRVAQHDLVQAAGRIIFLSQRFDRKRARKRDHRIAFMSAMTEHRDGDSDCSYLELVEAITERSAQPEEDRAEQFRRMAFTIFISNTDDHFRNHGFLWTGRKGWVLSPAYDINPVPNGPRILSTRLDFDEAMAGLCTGETGPKSEIQLMQPAFEHDEAAG